jgi:hypothetical protein
LLHQLAGGGKQQQPGAKTCEHKEQKHGKEKHAALHQNGPLPQTGHFIVGRSQRGDIGQIKREGDNVETSKTKPDLMAGAASSRRPAQGQRILAQLEHGARPPARAGHSAGWTIDGWTIGLCALLLMMCSMAWLMHNRTITPDTFRQSESRRGSSRAAVKTTMPVQPTAEVTPQAAAIVNVEITEAPSAEAETPTAATVAIANAAATARLATAQPQPVRALASAPKAAMRTAAPTVSAPASTDTDVTLLTALVAHAGVPSAVTPERSRDIVDRQDGDSTVQLLARCKQLGLIEGMLCRSRICSGRWESDAACRAPSH